MYTRMPICVLQLHTLEIGEAFPPWILRLEELVDINPLKEANVAKGKPMAC